MKTIYALLWGCALLLLSHNVSAQGCDSLSDFEFESSSLGITQGFASSDILTCVTVGQPSELLIPFVAYSTISSATGTDTVTQISFGTPTNIPCGMCWGMNKTSHTYGPGESGCFLIRGTSTGTVGQYVLNIPVTLTLASGATQQTTVQTLGGTNGKIVLRLIDSDGSIQPVNYNATGNSSPCNQ